MELKLIRLSDKQYTQLGVLYFQDTLKLVTLELPWRDNEVNRSCIPSGEYTCIKTQNRITTGGMHIPVTFEVIKVPGRGGVLFHVGNTEKDTNGCILVGMRIGELHKKTAILSSRTAFSLFLQELKSVDKFKLTIKSL